MRTKRRSPGEVRARRRCSRTDRVLAGDDELGAISRWFRIPRCIVGDDVDASFPFPHPARTESDCDGGAMSSRARSWRTEQPSENGATNPSSKGPEIEGNRKGGSPGLCQSSRACPTSTTAAGISPGRKSAELKNRSLRPSWCPSSLYLRPRRKRVVRWFHPQGYRSLRVSVVVALSTTTTGHGAPVQNLETNKKNSERV